MAAIDEKALGKRLQLARRRSGLTQQELCHKAKLSYSTLAKIERGAIRTPSVFTVSAIAQATGTSVESLLGIKSTGTTDTKKTSKTGIKFVYFDVNGTLVRFYTRAFSKIAQDSGRPSDIVETIYWRHNEAANRGNVSPKNFNAMLAKEIGTDSIDWQKYYLSSVEPMPGMMELAKWVAEHYDVGLLSNSIGGFIDELRKINYLPDIEYTAIVDSSRVGAIKPESRIYEQAEQLASVKPNEILLIDDSRANLTAADKKGWHVLWFDDYQPAASIERIREALAF